MIAVHVLATSKTFYGLFFVHCQVWAAIDFVWRGSGVLLLATVLRAGRLMGLIVVGTEGQDSHRIYWFSEGVRLAEVLVVMRVSI